MAEPIAVSEVQAAEIIGVSVNTFRDLVQQGHLPSPRKVPGKRRFLYLVEELKSSIIDWQKVGEERQATPDRSAAQGWVWD